MPPLAWLADTADTAFHDGDPKYPRIAPNNSKNRVTEA
jgi:hypothetical protein